MKEEQDDEIFDRDTMRQLAETPRTDARCAESQQLKTMAMRFAWMCDHARTLERELATERARLDWLESDVGMDWQCNNFAGGFVYRAKVDAAMKEGAK